MNKLYFNDSVFQLFSEDFQYLQDNIEYSLEQNFAQTVNISGNPSIVYGFSLSAKQYTTSDNSNIVKFNVYGSDSTTGAVGGLCDSSGKLFTSSSNWLEQSFTENYTDTVAGTAMDTATNSAPVTYAVYAILGESKGSFDRVNNKVNIGVKSNIDLATNNLAYDRTVDTITIVSQNITSTADMSGVVAVELGRVVFTGPLTFSINLSNVHYTKTRITDSTITNAMVASDAAISQSKIAVSSSTSVASVSSPSASNSDNVHYSPSSLMDEIDNIKSNIMSIKGISTAWDTNDHGKLVNLDPAAGAMHKNGVIGDNTSLAASISATADNTIILGSGKYYISGNMVINPQPLSIELDDLPYTSYSTTVNGVTVDYRSTSEIYSSSSGAPGTPYVFPEYASDKYTLRVNEVYGYNSGTTFLQDIDNTLSGKHFRINNGNAYSLIYSGAITAASKHTIPTNSYTLIISTNGSSYTTYTVPVTYNQTWTSLLSQINTVISPANLEATIESGSKMIIITNKSRSDPAKINISTTSTLSAAIKTATSCAYNYVYNFWTGSLTPIYNDSTVSQLYSEMSVRIKYDYAHPRFDAIVCESYSGTYSFGVESGNQERIPNPVHSSTNTYDTLYQIFRWPFDIVTAVNIRDCRSYVNSVRESVDYLVSTGTVVNSSVLYARSIVKGRLGTYIGYDSSGYYVPIPTTGHFLIASGSSYSAVYTSTIGDYLTIPVFSKKSDEVWAYFDIGPNYGNATGGVTFNFYYGGTSTQASAPITKYFYYNKKATRVLTHITSGLPAGDIDIKITFNEATSGSYINFYGLTIGRLDQYMGILATRQGVMVADSVITEAADIAALTVTGSAAISTLTVSGALTGSLTGNADTATKLKTSKTIAGSSFDGSSNIDIDASKLSGTALSTSVTTVGAASTTIDVLGGIKVEKKSEFVGDVTCDAALTVSGTSTFKGTAAPTVTALSGTGSRLIAANASGLMGVASGTYAISISGNAATASSVAWRNITNTPTSLGSYGVTSVDWSLLTSKPTTISGYGISDFTSSLFNAIAPTLRTFSSSGTYPMSAVTAPTYYNFVKIIIIGGGGGGGWGTGNNGGSGGAGGGGAYVTLDSTSWAFIKSKYSTFTVGAAGAAGGAGGSSICAGITCTGGSAGVQDSVAITTGGGVTGYGWDISVTGGSGAGGCQGTNGGAAGGGGGGSGFFINTSAPAAISTRSYGGEAGAWGGMGSYEIEGVAAYSAGIGAGGHGGHDSGGGIASHYPGGAGAVYFLFF